MPVNRRKSPRHTFLPETTPMADTSWRILISEALSSSGATWDDVESCTLSDAELDVVFDAGFGIDEGAPFTLWTKDRVYFPVQYDGSEWCESVPRNPPGKATRHVGGGC